MRGKRAIVFKKQFDNLEKGVFFLSAGVVIIVTLLLLIYPDESRVIVSGMMSFLTNDLGFLYIITYVTQGV